MIGGVNLGSFMVAEVLRPIPHHIAVTPLDKSLPVILGQLGIGISISFDI